MATKTVDKTETFDVAGMIDELAAKGAQALKGLEKLNQEQIDHIVHEMSMAALDKHMPLAKLAVEETGRGIYEDKAIKNMYASEYIWNAIKDNKTVGVIKKRVSLRLLNQSVLSVVLRQQRTRRLQPFLKQ